MNILQRSVSIAGLIMLWINVQTGFTQVGINSNGATPHPSAMLEVSSNNKGALLPRMTTAERKAIANPAAGLLVFDADKATLYLFDGVYWLPLAITSTEHLPPISRTPADLTGGEQFGVSVCLFGDYAIVGAYSDSIGDHFGQGSAYIFHRSNNAWTQQAKLTAFDGQAYDEFGYAVAITADYAVVGAWQADVGNKADQGSAYVFQRNGANWTQMAKLTDSNGLMSDFFGSSVAISGDNILVGALGDDEGGNADQGSASFFLRSGNTWIQQAKVTAQDAASNDNFGYSVSISGDKALISAINDDIGGNTNQGSAYIFQRSGNLWNQQAKLTALDGGANDQFGHSVSISGSLVVVGANGYDVLGSTNVGGVYTYAQSGATWTQLPVLIAPDGNSNDQFGFSVAISGDYLMVGAYYDNTGGAFVGQGSCYLYHKSGSNWIFIRKIELENARNLDYTGWSVSLNGYWVLFGSKGRNQVSFLNFEE